MVAGVYGIAGISMILFSVLLLFCLGNIGDRISHCDNKGIGLPTAIASIR
jgi:hypothetical protein